MLTSRKIFSDPGMKCHASRASITKLSLSLPMRADRASISLSICPPSVSAIADSANTEIFRSTAISRMNSPAET